MYAYVTYIDDGVKKVVQVQDIKNFNPTHINDFANTLHWICWSGEDEHFYKGQILLIRDEEELNTVTHIWNTHRIRAQRNSTAPQGRPLMMYTVPHLYGAEDHLCPCTMENIVNCEEKCNKRRNYSCDKTVFELCCLLMDEHRLDPPDNTEQATDLYITLKQEIRDLL
ncbi:UNVERIFIED_CONTAM: hypothetical protein FKN15_062854 [Acipenser sinensis]